MVILGRCSLFGGGLIVPAKLSLDHLRIFHSKFNIGLILNFLVLGISMHKGYAFVQFTVPFDARSACLGEDGKLICGQTLG